MNHNSRLNSFYQPSKVQSKEVRSFTVVNGFDGESYILMASSLEELSEMIRDTLSGGWGIPRVTDTYLLASKLWNGQFVSIFSEVTFIVPGVLTGLRWDVGYEELVQQ